VPREDTTEDIMDTLGTALQAAAPLTGSADRLATFARFIGSWDLEWRLIRDDVETAEAKGELHFGWVLGGRAIQDVWIVPGPDEPGAGQPPYAFHGTTIRFHDPQLGAWRSTWVEPVNNRVRKFIGRERDGEIHLVSLDESPFLRWRFTEITPDSFTWLGEYSVNEARDWVLEERMRATRRR
jgi:hypothetical protein